MEVSNVATKLNDLETAVVLGKIMQCAIIKYFNIQRNIANKTEIDISNMKKLAAYFTVYLEATKNIELLVRRTEKLKASLKIETVAAWEDDRRMSLLFGEIQENLKEDLKSLIVNLVRKVLNIDLTKGDIRFCYRYGEKCPKQDRPILVRFQSQYIYSLVWQNRKKLIKRGYTINVHLPMKIRFLLSKTRQLFGNNKCALCEGRIVVITAEGVKHFIESESKLNELKGVELKNLISPSSVS